MLTAIQCKNARPLTIKGASPPKPLKLFDGGGLFLLVKPNGAKHWRLKYRFGGKEKLLALGSFELVSLAEAREKRDAAKKLLLADKDPATVREQTRTDAAVTFKQVGEAWLATKSYAAKTLEKARWLFDSWLYPTLGAKPINSIESDDVLPIIRRAEAEGSLETAHRVRSRASQVFRFAIAESARWGNCKRDPAADVRAAVIPRGKVRHHPGLTEPRAVGGLLRAIDSYDGQPSVRLALRIYPHIFPRPIELRSATWPEFDTAGKVWRIPAERMKMREPHIVPLSKQVLAMLEELRAITGHQIFLFPAIGRRGRYMSENTLGGALRNLGYSGDQQTAHGFRTTASTLLTERGFAPALVELQLAHTEPNKVRAAYNHAEQLRRRARMLQAWSDYLDKLRKMKPADTGK